MPTTRLTQQAKEQLIAIAQDASKRNTETTAHLLGYHNKDGIGVITRVERIGKPTEHARMTRPDRSTVGTRLDPLIPQGYRILGEAHRHWNLIGLSDGDIATLQSLDPNIFPGYRCLVVTTFNNEQEPVMECQALNRDGTITEHDLLITDERDPFVYQPYLPPNTSAKTVVQFGAGSGGGLLAVQLGKPGLERLVIVDPDTVEARNLDRHVLGRHSVGRNKARALRDLLRERTTTKVYDINLTVSPQSRGQLDRLVMEADLLVNATGHPVASSILCSVAREHQIPIIHAGVYAQGAGGFVFYQDPRSSEPCYDCIFQHTRRSRPDDNATIEALTRNYGFTPEQLDHQLGLFGDVNVIAAIHAKIVIEALKGQAFDNNLWVIDNHHLGINATLVRQDPTCTTCHPI
jgi:molybdopterin/thiamine biosynthesis adenylyltransferase